MLQQQKKTPAAEVPPLQRTSVASALRFATAFPADPRAGPVLADAAEKLYALHDGAQAARGGAAGDRPAAARRRRPAPRRLDRARPHLLRGQNAFDRAEKAYAEVLKLTPERIAARNDLVERQAAAIYKQGEQARAAGQTRDAAAISPGSRRWRRSRRCAAAAQYDASAALIVAEGLGRRDPHAGGFPQPLPEPPLQGEVSGKLARRLSGEGPVGQRRRRVRSRRRDDQPRSEDRPRRALAGGRAVREGRIASRPRPRPTSATSAKYPQPLEPAIEARWRLARLAAADGNVGARSGADEGDLLRRPGRRRRPHRPHPLPGRDCGAGTGRAGRRRVPQGGAGRAAAAPAAAEEDQDGGGAEGLRGGRRLRRGRRHHCRDLPHRHRLPRLRQGDDEPRSGRRSCARSSSSNTTCCSRSRPSRSRRRRPSCTRSTPAAPRPASTTSGCRASFDALRELRPVRYGKVEHSEGVVDAIR